MSSRNLAMGFFFFSQAAVGILGNSSLLFHYFLSVLTGKSLMPKDHILKHLTLANFLTIVSRIPQRMAEFELRYFLDDLGCKLVIYINRVSRGVSLYTTCLLSCFQVITVSTSNTVWVKLTHRAIRYMSPSCALCWLTQLLLNSRITVRVSDLHSNRNATKRFSLGYCSGFVSGSIVTPLYVFLLCLTDGLCLGLMAWASGSMVSILCRHKKRVQYIHSAHQSPRVSPEARATRFILILVSTFITFYSLSSTLVLYIVFFDDPNLWVMKIFAFLETCFPTICPFVLISNSNCASRLCLPCWRNR